MLRDVSEQRHLAAPPELVLVRLHAQQEPALAGRDRVAETAQLLCAGRAQLLDRAADALAHLRLLLLPQLLQVLLLKRLRVSSLVLLGLCPGK